MAVIVDLDSVHAAPDRLVRAGIGDAVSNLSAIADWELAVADAGERIDGLAVTLARTAAQAVLHQPGTIASDEFLTVLAEALILSGMAMTVAGSSRPCSGGDHEILHAIDQLYPGAGTHGELAGRGRAVLRLPAGGRRPGRPGVGLPGAGTTFRVPPAIWGCRRRSSPRRSCARPAPAPAGTPSWSTSG